MARARIVRRRVMVRPGVGTGRGRFSPHASHRIEFDEAGARASGMEAGAGLWSDCCAPSRIHRRKPVLSDVQLRQIMPNLAATRLLLYLPALNLAMQSYEVNTVPRTAAFVAQLAHESGEFRWMEEIWGPTDAQRRYEAPNTLRREARQHRGRRWPAVQGARADPDHRPLQRREVWRPARHRPGGRPGARRHARGGVRDRWLVLADERPERVWPTRRSSSPSRGASTAARMACSTGRSITKRPGRRRASTSMPGSRRAAHARVRCQANPCRAAPS